MTYDIYIYIYIYICRGLAIPDPRLGGANHRSRNEMGSKMYEDSGCASLAWSFIIET